MLWSQWDIKIPMHRWFWKLGTLFFKILGKLHNGPFLGIFRGGLDFFDPLEISLEMAHYVVCPKKNNILHFQNQRCFNSYYAPMIYTAPFVMLLMRAASITWASGRGWALEIESFLGPVKWHRAYRRVSFGAQKTRDIQGPTVYLRTHRTVQIAPSKRNWGSLVQALN